MRIWCVRNCFYLSISLMLVGCTEDESPGVLNAGKLALATFNTGLATGFVDYASDRAPLIASALATLQADVVCLQEVWAVEHIDAIVQATAEAFPYNYYELTAEDPIDSGDTDLGTDSGAGAACSEEETATLGGCVETHCGGVDPENLSGCVLGNCGTEFGNLSTECSSCLIANLGGTIEEILDACSGSGGGTMAYGGRNGLLLLSKRPLTATEFLTFKSFLNRRVVLHARVDALDETVDVFCTHLTANLTSPAYAGEYASWEAERAAQIAEMLPYIEEKRIPSGRVALMGDMNCGPATANVSAEYAENYQLFLGGGLVEPYIDDASHQCTWCLDNPLVGADSGGVNSVIDHVLVK
ncbi:MAG: endonuclease/exonuclease/phosphatase family protein, partial [Myxococcota bacterium]|nr:endonuclease/exonuclease/phosphatase family protein [Myxococcota bacterium]